MPAARILTGQTLHNTYAIGRVVGEGGFGRIYEATHVRLNRRLAVKVLAAEKEVRPEAVKRFWREAEVMSRLGHPHIVEVLDVNQTEEGTPYIVMEFLVGDTLAQRIERDGALGLAEASAVLEQVASALDAVHAEGIIHRDLKPGNIILCQARSEPWVKVIDFGLSRLLDPGAGFRTGPGGIIGSPSYMSPEQIRSANIGPPADLFALGVVAYEMACGKLPFQHEDVGAILNAICSEEAPAPTVVRPGLPAGLDGFARHALAKAPAARFHTGRALVEAFVQAIWPSLDDDDELRVSQLKTRLVGTSGQDRVSAELEATLPPEGDGPAPTASSTQVVPPSRPARSRLVWVAAAVLLVLVGAVAGVLVLRRGPGPDRPIASPRAAVPDRSRAVVAESGEGREPDRGRAEARTPDAAARSGRLLTVRTEPEGASVWVDGWLAGTTPLDGVSLAADARTVVIKKKGFRTVQRRIPPSGPAVLDLPLVATRTTAPPPTPALAGVGSLRVAVTRGGEPQVGIRILIDGKVTGHTPFKQDLPAGRHRVDADVEGAGGKGQWVTIKPGEIAKVGIELSP